MDYTVTIDDGKEWAVTAAREENNASRQPTIPDPNNPGEEIPNPLIFADNPTYVQFVMVRAVDSWVVHFPEQDPNPPPEEIVLLDALFSENSIPMSARNTQLYAAIRAAMASDNAPATP